MIIEKRVNTITEGDQEGGAITGLAGGGYLVTWTSYIDHADGSRTTSGIYAQRYNANNTKQGSEFRVNTTVTGFESGGAIAPLNNGGFIITWASPDADGKGILAQRYNSNGIPQGSEFRVNNSAIDDQAGASVATLSNGSFIIMWHSENHANFTRDIYAQRYSANGIEQGPEILVSTGDRASGQIAALENGGFLITWIADTFNPTNIHGQRYDANGVAIGQEFVTNSQNTMAAQGLSVASLNNGGFVVTWSNGGEIYGQRFDVNGATAGAEFKINTFTPEGQISTFVTTLTNGDFVVMWPSRSQDGYLPLDYGIYGQIFSASGVKKGSEFPVNTFIAGDQIFPHIAPLTDGGFVAAWTSTYQDGAGQGVYARRFDANGKATDILVNTSGNDILNGTSAAEDDAVSYANAASAVTVSLNITGQQNTIGAGFDTLSGIEHLVGSSFGDALTGNEKDNALFGGNGNDTLAGWSGADNMIGGPGNDTYFVENFRDIVIEKVNEGIDTVNTRVSYAPFEHIENIILTGTSAIDATGTSQANIITGNGAVNFIRGGLGNDTLLGKAGNDTLWGEDSNDTLQGDSGNDELNGGRGNDKLDGGTGTNILTGEGGSDIFKFTTTGHIDTITDYNVPNDTIQLENAVFTALTISGTLAASQFRIGTKAIDANDHIIYNNITGSLIYDANGNGTGAMQQIATLSAGLTMTNADIVVI